VRWRNDGNSFRHAAAFQVLLRASAAFLIALIFSGCSGPEIRKTAQSVAAELQVGFWYVWHLPIPLKIPSISPDARAESSAPEQLLSRQDAGESVGKGRQWSGRAAQPSRGLETMPLLRQSPAAAVSPFLWDFIGPMPIFGAVPNFGGGFTGPALTSAAGRVTAIAADPTARGRVFVGTAGGGVWMTSDGGLSFRPIFEDQPSLSIGSIALDTTTRPPTIYVGTGEGNTATAQYGLGIFKSADLGTTWTELAPGTFARVAIGRLALDPSNHNHIFAAVKTGASLSRGEVEFNESNPKDVGLWESDDGGASFIQFSDSVWGCASPCAGEDILFDPSRPKTIYTAILTAGVFRSTDGGTFWDPVSFPGVVGRVGRVTLAAALSAPGTVYAAVGSRTSLFWMVPLARLWRYLDINCVADRHAGHQAYRRQRHY
jgi:hypothetical protein